MTEQARIDSDGEQVDRLRALGFWRGPIAVAPLAGGLTNHNYLVRSGETTYVGRVSSDGALLGIDRDNEAACQRLAHARGVAPAVVYDEPGVLVSEYLSGRTLTDDDLRDHALLVRLAALLETLHRALPGPVGLCEFSAFSTVETYAATALGIAARLPGDLDRLLDDARALARSIEPIAPRLCHNDLLAANILEAEDRLWLVDWEYAGLGDPRFDLGCVSANHDLTASLDAAFLTAYWGRSDPRDLADLAAFKAIARLREALWGVIQTVVSDVDFDYQGYADRHFQAFRRAVS